MASPCFWHLCVFLPAVIAQASTGLPLPVPEIIYSHYVTVWKLIVGWRNNFTNSSRHEQITYDMEIFHTEQMRLVHNETVKVKPDLNGTHFWNWTSPIHLGCTSHSVRLRAREHSLTSDWTTLHNVKGNDSNKVSQSMVYPKDSMFHVGDDITFCCIVKDENVAAFNSSDFKIRISNRTYITDPIRRSISNETSGYSIQCNDAGASYYVGSAPDDHNLTCETRTLTSVECYWSPSETGKYYKFLVIYTINESECSLGECSLAIDIDQGMMNWTLTARNELGTKTITDQGDPKHRVRLKAPMNVQGILVHARNATLEWNWKGTMENKSFSITCQVELNGHTLKEMFNGTTLMSLVLADLQPFRTYTARVRCGALNHFYKWGDWSDPTSFSTKGDIPEALDVWMQDLDGQTYVLWKNQSQSQSHGVITSYELLVGSSMDLNQEKFSKAPYEHCHNLSSSAKRDHYISVSAKNDFGVSPPSNITIPTLPSGPGNVAVTIVGHDGGFNITWKTSPISSCGYVVEWFQTNGTEPCGVKWMKFSPEVSNATIYSDFKKGVKYMLSVYACTSAAPQLLHRKEVYVEELAPPGDKPLPPTEQHAVFGLLLTCLVTTLVVFIIFVLFFSSRQWLRNKVYPNIPKPVLPGEMFIKESLQCPLIDEMLHEESQALRVKHLELCPEVVPPVQKENKEVDSVGQEYINDACDSQLCPVTIDLPMRAPNQIILNPSYNMPLSPLDCDLPALGYVPHPPSSNL
ncbi:leukemia inhibitory factor receptor-like isoform X2 [Hoplias malabaricus]|uniref:leukemia inhibitory factor receptor-like isoform X2 n=1 Tax=Hoplias malabaricus TaxID=27720 RepID=UPI003462AA9C